jgi:peptidoglycan/LPS O-acetylase OafA/YrhL
MSLLSAFKSTEAEKQTRYSLGYNPRLDGLRAVAVLFVLCAHYRIPGFVGGGYGVDIFFVLSGFLITQVLIKDLEKERTLLPFYWRRFLRLAPALAWLCLALALFSLFFKNWADFETARQDILSSVFYVANWTRAFSLGSPLYLGNCWSLAIEEQFYLLWPLFFLIFGRKNNIKHLIAGAFSLLLVSISWAVLATFNQYSSARIYNGFDTHSSGLLIGCCLALILKTRRGEAFLKAGGRFWPLSIIVFAFLVGFRATWSIFSSLLAVGAAVLLILAACYSPRSLAGRFLELRPVIAVGKISYSLYLWHYPIFLAMYLHGAPWTLNVGIGIPLSFLAAAFSYWFIEQPILRLRATTWMPVKRLGLVAVSFSILGILAGGTLFLRETITDAFFFSPTSIVAYGPHVLKAGESFNVQADGESYLWMKASRTIPHGTKLRIGSRLLEANGTGRGLSARLPRDLLSEIKKSEMVIIGPNGYPLAPPVPFEVTADSQ